MLAMFRALPYRWRPPAAAQYRIVYSAHDLLQRTVAELTAFRRTLGTHGMESNVAQRQLALACAAIARANAKVSRLEQEVVELRHCAYHDELTGLPNRSLLLDRLSRAIAQAARQRKQVALLLLDLDGFKTVNDTFGHAAGDQLLQRVAQRLLASTRNADTTSRYGGDEFVILLPEVEDENRVTEVAHKIHARLTEPFLIGGYSMVVTACIGTATYPGDGTRADDLLERADTAMYIAKYQAHSAATAAPAPYLAQPGLLREAAARRRLPA
jgi:diguanylate cyclase (GGDEF)-like protein